MKKLIIASDSLKSAFKKLAISVDKRSTLPVLTNIYCVVEKDGLIMTTSDLELTITVKCAAEVGIAAGLEFLIPFDFVHDIVAIIQSQPITLEYHSARKINLVTDTDIFEINSLEKQASYPNIPTVPKKNAVTLTEDFIDLLHKAMLTVSKDDLRPAMTCACLDFKKNETLLVSTNAHCLYKHKIDIKSEEPEQLLISHKVARALVGLKDAELTWTTKNIAFKSGNTTIVARRMEAKFPDYKVVIPEVGPALPVEKHLLVDALNKACLNSAAIKQTTIFLKRSPDHIEFEAKDVDMERNFIGRVPGTFPGDTEHITVNAATLLTCLDQVDEDAISLHVLGSTKAILITAEKNADYLGLVMPLMLN